MFAFAYGHNLFAGRVGSRILHGLELVAVAVIAQAVWGMMQTLAPDRTRATIAVLAAGIVLLSSRAASQLAAIALGAILGLLVCREASASPRQALRISIPRSAALVSFAVFAVLLIAPAILVMATRSQAVALFQAFYRSGALVFGGGHVVLPLLRAATVSTGWIDDNTFLAGYGAAQAVPGPLFTFSIFGCRCKARASRGGRSNHRSVGTVSAWAAARDQCLAVLESTAFECENSRTFRGCQRKRGRNPAGGFVSTRMDE